MDSLRAYGNEYSGMKSDVRFCRSVRQLGLVDYEKDDDQTVGIVPNVTKSATFD